MKKLAAILIVSVYLTLTAGFSINFHYCQDQLESVSVIPGKNNCCCGVNNDNSGCCSNKSLFIQFDSEDQLVQNAIVLPQLIDYKLVEKSSEHLFVPAVIEKYNHRFTHLPPPRKRPIWVTNCSFIFYG